jgi:hypothetical protein
VSTASPGSEPPVAASVAWLRAYSMPCSVEAIRSAARGGTLDKNDARHVLADGQVADGDDQFWDVQVLRRAHVVRVISTRAIQCCHPTTGEWMAVDTHLLLHVAGLALIRLTLHPGPADGDITMSQLVDYSDAVWRDKQLTWRINVVEEQMELDADVRRAMDLVMLPMNERFCGRAPDVAELSQLQTAEARSQWLDQRVEAGESLSAYPVTFGTAYELVWTSQAAQHQALESVAELAYGTKKPFEDGSFLKPADAGYAHDWFVGENRSVLALAGLRERTPIGTFDSLRTQTLEYLTLQRAALRTVQRATQVTITERRPINRKQLQQWQRLVASMTDEYVLHDQVAMLFRPLRKHMTDNALVRDPATLEAQVRQNLETFQDVISAANNRVAIILSGLFGVVAAITLAPLARDIELTIFRTGGSAGTFDSGHIVLSIVIDLLLLTIVGSIAGVLISRANRLRWPKR